MKFALLFLACTASTTAAFAVPSNYTMMGPLVSEGQIEARDSAGSVVIESVTPSVNWAYQQCRKDGYRVSRIGEHVLPATSTTAWRQVQTSLSGITSFYQTYPSNNSIVVPATDIEVVVRNVCEHGSWSAALWVTTEGRCRNVSAWFGPSHYRYNAEATLARHRVDCTGFDTHNSTKLLWMFYSDALRDHRQVAAADATNEAFLDADYRFVTADGTVLSQPDVGTTPLRLAYSAGRDDYVLVASGATQGELTSKGYALGAVQGHVFSSQVSGTIPLMLFYSAHRDEYALTTREDRRGVFLNAGYEYVRNEGFVFP